MKVRVLFAFLIVVAVLVGVNAYLGNPAREWLSTLSPKEKSDVYVFVYRYKYSPEFITKEKLDPLDPSMKITPLSYPKGVKTVDFVSPVIVKDWKEIEGKNLFVVVIQNRENETVPSVNVVSDFGDVEVFGANLPIDGEFSFLDGSSTTTVAVGTSNLLPHKERYFEIISSADNVESVKASVGQNNLENVFIFDASLKSEE